MTCLIAFPLVWQGHVQRQQLYGSSRSDRPLSRICSTISYQPQTHAAAIHFVSKNGLSSVTGCCRTIILTEGIHLQLQLVISHKRHSPDEEVHRVTIL